MVYKFKRNTFYYKVNMSIKISLFTFITRSMEFIRNLKTWYESKNVVNMNSKQN